jgi:hypothetical protein
MPTLGNIQKQIAMYLKRSLVDFDVSGDTGQNLVLTALNNARRHAEKMHDFSICRQRGYFSFADKAAWDSPTWYDGATEKLRKGKLWDLRTQGNIAVEFGGTNIPLKMVRSDTKHQLESRRAYDAAVGEFELRALPDSTLLFDHPFLNQAYIMTRGKWLEYYPYSAETKNIMVDGYRWWPDWTIAGRASVVLKDMETAGFYQFADIGDGDVLNITIGELGNQEVFQFEFDNNATTSGANIPISLPTTREAIAAAINSAGFAGGNVATVVGDSIIITTSTTGPTVNVLVTMFAVATTGGYTFIGESLGAAEAVSDWWTENASEYLLWRALVECNHLGHVFTANREANLPSPDKKADIALALLIQNDQDAENPGEIQQY